MMNFIDGREQKRVWEMLLELAILEAEMKRLKTFRSSNDKLTDRYKMSFDYLLNTAKDIHRAFIAERILQ